MALRSGFWRYEWGRCVAVRLIPGRVHLYLEEGTQSAWIHELLKPHVAEIVVSMPSKKKGAKDDQRDAWARAEELRVGGIETRVYKAPEHLAALRVAVRAHRFAVTDAVRATNRLKAVYLGRGLSTDASVYEPEQRERWLKKLSGCRRHLEWVASGRHRWWRLWRPPSGFAEMDVWEQTAAQARATRLLGELPLVVISAEETEEHSPASPFRAARGTRFPLLPRFIPHPRRHNPWVAGHQPSPRRPSGRSYPPAGRTHPHPRREEIVRAKAMGFTEFDDLRAEALSVWISGLHYTGQTRLSPLVSGSWEQALRVLRRFALLE